MKNNKLFKKITAFLAMAITVISMVPSSAFAAEVPVSSETDEKVLSDNNIAEEKVLVDSGIIEVSPRAAYDTGYHDLGGFTFTDFNRGSDRIYYGNRLKVKPAWKPADKPSSEIDLLIEVRRASDNQLAFQKRFTLSDDEDGKDSAGWWYAESPWISINSGSAYYIYYEAFTTPDYTPTGDYRKAHVHTWIEVAN